WGRDSARDRAILGEPRDARGGQPLAYSPRRWPGRVPRGDRRQRVHERHGTLESGARRRDRPHPGGTVAALVERFAPEDLDLRSRGRDVVIRRVEYDARFRPEWHHHRAVRRLLSAQADLPP